MFSGAGGRGRGRCGQGRPRSGGDRLGGSGLASLDRQCRPGTQFGRRVRPGVGRRVASARVAQHRQPQAEAQQDQGHRKGRDGPGGDLVRHPQAHRVVGARGTDQRPGHEDRKPGVAAGPPAGVAQGQGGRAGDDEHRVEDGRVQPGQRCGHPCRQRDVAHGVVRQGEGGRGHGQDADHDRDVREQAAAGTAPGELLLAHREEPFMGNLLSFPGRSHMSWPLAHADGGQR